MKTIIEISINGEKVFANYPDGNVLIKNDTQTLDTAKKEMQKSMDYIDKFCKANSQYTAATV